VLRRRAVRVRVDEWIQHAVSACPRCGRCRKLGPRGSPPAVDPSPSVPGRSGGGGTNQVRRRRARRARWALEEGQSQQRERGGGEEAPVRPHAPRRRRDTTTLLRLLLAVAPRVRFYHPWFAAKLAGGENPRVNAGRIRRGRHFQRTKHADLRHERRVTSDPYADDSARDRGTTCPARHLQVRKLSPPKKLPTRCTGGWVYFMLAPGTLQPFLLQPFLLPRWGEHLAEDRIRNRGSAATCAACPQVITAEAKTSAAGAQRRAAQARLSRIACARYPWRGGRGDRPCHRHPCLRPPPHQIHRRHPHPNRCRPLIHCYSAPTAGTAISSTHLRLRRPSHPSPSSPCAPEAGAHALGGAAYHR
jgi:hypothetical protein